MKRRFAVSWIVLLALGACNIIELAKNVDQDLTKQFAQHKELMYQYSFRAKVVDKKMTLSGKNTTFYFELQLSNYDSLAPIVHDNCAPYYLFEGHDKLKIMVNNYLFNAIEQGETLTKDDRSYDLNRLAPSKLENHFEWLSNTKGQWNKR